MAPVEERSQFFSKSKADEMDVVLVAYERMQGTSCDDTGGGGGLFLSRSARSSDVWRGKAVSRHAELPQVEWAPGRRGCVASSVSDLPLKKRVHRGRAGEDVKRVRPDPWR